MQLVIINKIARLKFIKNQPNHPKFVHKLLNKGILAIKSYCNFLTIFFKKKYPNIPQKMSVDEQICEPYLPNDEELYKIPKKIDKDHKIQLKKNSSRLLISERFLRKATTTNSLEYIFERFDPRSLFDEDYKEDDEYFDKVMERERYKLQKVYGNFIFILF